MPRPRVVLPDELIANLARKGMGRAAIVDHLRNLGHDISPGVERTVGRRIAESRAAKPSPGAVPRKPAAASRKAPAGVTSSAAAPSPTAPPAANVATSGEVDDADDGGGELPGEGLDIEALPAALLTVCAQETAKAMRWAVRNRQVVAADKLATILERFALRLVEVRPPEKVDPIKDPTNIEARREILRRWDALREPWEIALPVIEAIEAHAADLRRKMEVQDALPPTAVTGEVSDAAAA